MTPLTGAWRRVARYGVIAVLLALALSVGCAGEDESTLPRRWLFVMRDLRQPRNLEQTIALLPRAEAAGYNALVLSDSNLYRLDRAGEDYKAGVLKLQREAKRHGMDLIPCVMPIGYSGAIIGADPNLAEGLPVKDALFVAQDGKAGLVADPPVSLPGGRFEDGQGARFAGWDMQDYPGKSTFVDREEAHSGDSSVRMEHIAEADPVHGHCRFMRTVKVRPFSQYHLSAWVKTDDFEAPGSVQITVLAPTEDERSVGNIRPQLDRTQGWQQYHLVFNSLNWDEVRIYFGAWNGKGGRLWWDDVQLEEIGLMNLLRRPGCPMSVRGENGTVYQEGRDFEPLRDPKLAPWEAYHEPPEMKLTPNTRIADGERLRVSYYHSIVIGQWQVMCCLSEPAVYDILRDQVKRVEELLHPTAFFMQHDEIRVGNWDHACRSRGMTPGQLLADNVSQCVETIRDIRPDAEIWVWSDMFDPMHNAVDNYYLVNGTWAGSWEGLPSEVGIVNWAGHLEGKNCEFFSKRGHEQVLAGYYDGDEDGSGIAKWLGAAGGVPGLAGAMYTTWEDKYDAMARWAERAWGRPQ